MTRSLLVYAAALMALLAVVKAQEKMALARLVAAVNSNVVGTLVLQQVDCHAAVVITGNVTGLRPGLHGFHLHQFGDVSDSCKFCGPHFNLQRMTHGGPTGTPRHTGDFGNVVADADGLAVVNIADRGISLCLVESCVLGRSLVVHEFQDDLGLGAPGTLTNVTGNVGPRIACGTIALRAEPPVACPPCPPTSA